MVLCHKMADGVNHMLLELLLVCVLSVSSLYGYKEEKYGLLMPNVHPNVVSTAVHLQNQSPIVENELSVGYGIERSKFAYVPSVRPCSLL